MSDLVFSMQRCVADCYNPARVLMNLFGKGNDVVDVRERWNRLLKWDDKTTGATTLGNTISIKVQTEEILRRSDGPSVYGEYYSAIFYAFILY